MLGLALGACREDTTAATGSGGSGTEGEPTAGGSADEGLDSTAEGGATEGDDVGGACVSDADCEDDDPCRPQSCNAGTCEAGEFQVSLECRPQIEVEFPPRAATLQADSPTVTVTGRVHSPAGPIEFLSLNGEDVTVDDDGSFSHDVVAQTGGNTLVFETADSEKTPRKRVQSFLWSTNFRLPTTAPEGIADDGLALYLSQETLDDQDRTPPIDDVASLLSLAVENFDINSFIDPTTSIASSAGYDVYLTSIDYESTSLAINAIDGGMEVVARLNDITGDLDFDCTNAACFFAGGDGSGGLSVNYIEVRSDLIVEVGPDNQLEVTPTGTSTNVNSLNIWSNNLWTNFLLAIIEPFIIGGVVNDLENELTSQINGLLGPALSEAFGGLAPNTNLSFPNLGDPKAPIDVQLVADFLDTDFHDGGAPPDPSPPQGGMILMRGGGYAVTPVAPHKNLGIPDRAGCGDGTSGLDLPREALLELGLGDDMLNQLLHGAWTGGLLEFDLPPELLGEGGLVSDLDIHISGMLSPTASDCYPDGQIRVHLGDIQIEGGLTLGVLPMTFVAYTSLVAGLELSPTKSGVGISITEVEMVDTELTVGEDEALEQEALVAATLEGQLVSALVDAIGGGGLGGIDLPPIDLSATLGLPPGTAALTVVAEEVHREPGITVISGRL
ncbi:MAG: hypothetical protein AAF799_39745 [Myxococcota bacterium]